MRPKEFITGKEQTTRNPETIREYNQSWEHSTEIQGEEKLRGIVDFPDQKFFNDFPSYMVSEHDFVRISNLTRPEHGLKPASDLFPTS